MNQKGKVIEVTPVETGQGKNGEWKKQFMILEFKDGSFDKKLCIAAWGDKTDMLAGMLGKTVDVHFNAESREYNGRWYTDLKLWKVDVGSSNPGIPSPIQEQDDMPF